MSTDSFSYVPRARILAAFGMLQDRTIEQEDFERRIARIVKLDGHSVLAWADHIRPDHVDVADALVALVTGKGVE